MATKYFIKQAIKHPGALRKTLKAKPGSPIPAETLTKATHSPNQTTARRARFAMLLRGMH